MTYYDQKLIKLSLWLETFCRESESGYVTYEQAREGFRRYGWPVKKDQTLTRQMREAAKRNFIGRGKLGGEAIFFPIGGQIK